MLGYGLLVVLLSLVIRSAVPQNRPSPVGAETVLPPYPVEALVLDDERAWIVSPDGATQVGEFTDVAAVYGWNYAGTKLLLGRGLYPTMGDLAKSTELWVYDLDGGKSYRLVDSTQIWSAAWSPVDDRVAYCEYGEIPTIFVVSSGGELQQKREEYFFSDLAWAPDGSAIVVSYSGPDMVVFDTRYSALGIWWLEDNKLQLLSDAKREAHYFPLWLMDGGHILFTRLFGQGSEGGVDGLYTVDLKTLQMVPVQNGPKNIVNRIMRSPRSDTFVFWMGYEVFIMELGKEPVLLGEGRQPIWHPDGSTVFYSDDTGLFQNRKIDTLVEDRAFGGFFSASTIHLQPELFFKWDAKQ